MTSTDATPTPPTTQVLVETALHELFAPWVQALGLQVLSSTAEETRLRLPHSEQLTRVGGIVCGQAMMAAADTAMALALMGHFGAFRPCTTVQLSSTFLKPLSQQDAIVSARLLRVGKTMAFGEIDISGANDGKSVYRASTSYMLM